MEPIILAGGSGDITVTLEPNKTKPDGGPHTVAGPFSQIVIRGQGPGGDVLSQTISVRAGEQWTIRIS